jgi:Coenzyme PQQ synthesis protein D (PqqD)
MLRARQFTVDPRRVVHETIDGETILIDLETGTYFSLRGCGSQVWALLASGWSETDVVAEMRRRYAAAGEAVGAAVAETIVRLADEGLLEDAGTEIDSPAGNIELEAATPGPYVPPVLERYTDMQYFLLLDPIHEVQDGGWPHAAPAPAEPTETG